MEGRRGGGSRGGDRDGRVVCFRLPFSVSHWAPVLLWMAVISYFSSRSTLPSPFSSPKYGAFFHSVAHFGEYAILSALLYRALAKQYQLVGAKANPGEGESLELEIKCWPLEHRSLGLSFITALLFALLDELHQSFIPGRDAELVDVAVDAVGMSVGLIVIRRGLAFEGREAGKRGKKRTRGGVKGSKDSGRGGVRV